MRRLVLPLIAILVTLNVGQMAVRMSFYGPGPLTQSRDVVIPPAGTAGAAQVLAADGAIRNPAMFRIAAWFTRGAGPLQAGEYLIPARSSLRDILEILRAGVVVEHQVTIPEGLTGPQIGAILNKAAEASGQVAPPADGAVLPETYDYTRGTARAAILARAEAAMQTTLAAAWAKRDPGLPLGSPGDALILASIVQQETPVADELPKIAAVYENRLAKGMKLQADPTVIYAASDGASSGGAAISRTDLESLSLYNTYVFSGLPPGPICAPGIAAIQAVLHPAATSALFFVATGAGGHVFADNFKQQLSNIAKYRATQRD